MTSEKRRAANRRNATRSTGPRSPAGKARASQNAYRHGLSAPMSNRPGDLEQFGQLFQALLPENPSLSQIEQARVAAEAQITVMRVRERKAALLKQLDELLESQHSPTPYDSGDQCSPAGSSESILKRIATLASTLERFDRYERRSLSKRKKALRTI